MQIWLGITALRCPRLVLPLYVDSVTLFKMLHLGQWLPYTVGTENTSWIAYISLQWQL